VLEVKEKKWYLDFSFFDKKGSTEFAKRLKSNSDDASKVFRIFFKNLNAEQTISVGRTVPLGDTEPRMVRIKFFVCHRCALSSITFDFKGSSGNGIPKIS